jgi:hypothetical protein
MAERQGAVSTVRRAGEGAGSFGGGKAAAQTRLCGAAAAAGAGAQELGASRNPARPAALRLRRIPSGRIASGRIASGRIASGRIASGQGREMLCTYAVLYAGLYLTVGSALG